MIACVLVLSCVGYVLKYKKSQIRVHIVMTCLILTVGLDYVCDHRYSLVNGAQPISHSSEHDYYQDKALLEAVRDQDQSVFARIEKTYSKGNTDALWSMTDYCRSASNYYN